MGALLQQQQAVGFEVEQPAVRKPASAAIVVANNQVWSFMGGLWFVKVNGG